MISIKLNFQFIFIHLTVEFGKFVGNDSHYNNKQKRNSNGSNKTNRENSDYVS
jgi:hypothetical protein